jgi:hypothetical protein
MKRKNNPARAGRSEYRSREVREIRDGGPYYTVKSEWLTHPPTLTEGHFYLPEVREAAVVAEHGREHGASLGRGNFGLTYLTQTVHGPVVVKVAATEALYGNRQRWSRVDQQNNMMHEAGVANELADMGYDVVPRTTYVELADGTPALVREYGDLADSVTPDEFYALETRLLALEKATGWRVQDDLLVLRRPDGSLFIGDVGIWQPPSARNGKTRAYDPLDSSLGSLLSKFAEAAFGQRDISSLPRIAHLMDALSNMDEDSFFVKVLREQMQEALASREAVGIPSPPGALAFAEDEDEADEERDNPAVVDEPGSPIAELSKKLDHRFLWSTRKAGDLVKNNYIRFVTDRGAEPTVWKVITHPKHERLNHEPVVMCQIKSLHDGTVRKREFWDSSEEVYVDV